MGKLSKKHIWREGHGSSKVKRGNTKGVGEKEKVGFPLQFTSQHSLCFPSLTALSILRVPITRCNGDASLLEPRPQVSRWKWNLGS